MDRIECHFCGKSSPVELWDEIAGGINPLKQAELKSMASLECPKCHRVVRGHQLIVITERG